MKKVIILLLCFAVWVLWANTAIEVNEWIVEDPEIPEGFDGFRIAQVSDLHNAVFGEGNEKLLKMLQSAEPDIIVLTGDLIDSQKTDVNAALDFVQEAVKIAPCYFVSGNHEAWSGKWTSLRAGLLGAGVRVLADEAVMLEGDGDVLTLAGVQDPACNPDFTADLMALAEGEGYTILLSHRPERMDQYAAFGVDLVLSGHAHGGQFRLPLLGGIFAPDQGLFPRYDSGLYRQEDTVMLVSRGLGNSIIPLRFNNRPEILIAILKRA